MVVSDQAPPGAEALLGTLASYLPSERVDAARAALDFAISCHDGQTRLSGDPYVTHPIAVAQLVADLRLDIQTVQAALLHDVIEDSGVTHAELSKQFGRDVARLVEGATKIERLPIGGANDGPSADAETLRKMLLAMAEDIRVVIVKLADRLHNMRTLEHLPADRQLAIATETLDIYAPLASRLGIWQFKWELEDLAFRYAEPEAYRRVARIISTKRSERERFVRRVESELRRALEEAEVEAEVVGRVKHLYSIHQKMRRYAAEGKSLDQIHDLLALRVLVRSVADCYNALGIVHQTWRPIPGSFDDYIANPKESLYQSLHTSVLGPGARPFEVQIRTLEMHELAEYGVAAHWQYKEEPRRRDLQYEERMAWLRHLIEWQQEASGTEDFLESVKTDVFNDQVFVYTPRGDVRVLPAGSTPLDFAYRIHTDLGHNCVGAKVNGRLVPLTTKLSNGDIVEIMRSRSPKGPSRDWLMASLGYLGSSHARQKVRQWFRRQQRSDNVDRGREQVDREVDRLGLARLPDDLYRQLGYESMEDLYAAVGSGDVSVQKLINRLAEQAPPSAPPLDAPTVSPRRGSPGVHVLGTSGLATTLSRCCRPVPGDAIIGYVTRSRGVSVHRRDCGNAQRADDSGRLIDCDWGPSAERYSAAVEVDAWDRVGLLRDISTIVAGDGVNMVGVRTEEHPDRTTTVHLTLETEGGAQFARLLSHLDGVRGVISVRRAGG
ncbi:MAG: bifunctional (p)ppGpp synthetase/guanosine-3',5'-bis(diphosphate) 3'-pyrophosphohydrolase [Chloroflexi bacterium]|nr:bifunctional (p)ppGpp synthetase/guanosine-3',5'-bis(diphosphate) 3'-pyrophosphohydrolase [Chloroflexota bacterium]